MPIWPFGSKNRPTSPLDAIDGETPLRFRVALADPTQRDAALQVLDNRLRTEAMVEAVDVPSGGVSLEIASTFSPGSAALMRPLNVLQRAGITVRDLQVLGLVTELDEGALRQAVEGWGQFANQGPHRRRLELLAGVPLLERCLAGLASAPDSGPARRSAWGLAVTCVVLNTPGAERRVVDEAAAEPDAAEAERLVSAAVDRVTLAALAQQPIDVPAQALASLIRRPAHVSERASFLARLMPSPLQAAIVDALTEVAGGTGERAVAALAALHQAEPSTRIRAVVDQALESDDANVQATALEVLAHHWGTEARPTWKAFLASRSAPMRWTAEAVLGLHGTEDDLADAAAHMAKLARTKSTIHMSPARGNEIVDLLVRHREHPTAQAALDDLSARWGRLGDDLREWLAEHHSWLDPARRADEPVTGVSDLHAQPEEELSWPPPSIEREKNGVLTLWFDEGAAHADVRERFELRAAGHPAIEVLDGDREWLSVRCAAPDPEALIRELWAEAS